MSKPSGLKAARGWAAAAIVCLIAGGTGRAQQPDVRVLERFTCSGKVGSYFAGIADRSIGGGINMCYFVSQSEVGRRILRTCPVDTNCHVIATVKIDSSGGYSSAIITDVISARKGESAERAAVSAPRFSDPHAYCRAVGAIDTPDNRYIGPDVTQQMRESMQAVHQGTVVWRCMDAAVFACVIFNSPVCGKFNPRQNISGIEKFCAENPDEKIIGAAITGRSPVQWVCEQGKPSIKSGDFRVDKRGFPVEYWKIIFPGNN
jgi:hypothetical protein